MLYPSLRTLDHMPFKFANLTLGFLAAICFAALPGCESQSTTTVTEASDSDHGHDHDSEHSHDDDGHSHDDHEGHDHADDHGEGHDHDFESLSEAVEEIESLRDTIRDELAAGDTEAAHGPLHHIYEVLDATKKCSSEIEDADQKKAVAAAIESLLDSFGAVDAGMHGSDQEENASDKKFKELSDSIDSAIETLKKEGK